MFGRLLVGCPSLFFKTAIQCNHIRSVLDYGTFLLFPIAKKDTKKLDQIQYKALRIIVGAMRNSPKEALQVETVDAPLNLRRQMLSDRFLFRCLQQSHHPLFYKLLKLNTYISSCKFWKKKDPPLLNNSFVNYNSIQFPKFHNVNTCSPFTLSWTHLRGTSSSINWHARGSKRRRILLAAAA